MTGVAIVGAHGKIAAQLMRLLYDRGDGFVGIVRGTDQAKDIYRMGGEGVVLDIEDATVEKLAEAFDGSDVVVFTAGAGGGSSAARTRSVDFHGSVSSADAAERVGIRRFVQVSAWGVDSPVTDDSTESWSAYVEAKRDADHQLRARDLDWTILRPGTLTLDEGSGRVKLAESVESGSISREDVARLIIAVIEDPRSAGRTWEVTSGDTPIDEAVVSALDAKER